MTEQRVVEMLAAHADQLVGQPAGMSAITVELSDDERDQLAPLLQLAEQLKQSMPPVRPSPAFVRSLKEELVASAGTQGVKGEHKRRSVLIGAAAVGSLVSIVGAVVYVVSRTHNHAQAPAG